MLKSLLFVPLTMEISSGDIPEETSDFSSEITEDIPEESVVPEEASEEIVSSENSEYEYIPESNSEFLEEENIVTSMESDADYSQMESLLETISENTLQIHNDNLMIFNRLEVCACLLILILLMHLIKLFTGIINVFFKS